MSDTEEATDCHCLVLSMPPYANDRVYRPIVSISMQS